MCRPTPHIAIRCRIWFCAIASLAISPAFVATAADKLSFNRNVRPILAENCFACHGPDSASRKAGLRLDRREVAVKMGAIMPGNPDESEMIHRIFASDDDERMPPPTDPQATHRGPEGKAQSLDRSRGRIPAALVVHPAHSARGARGKEPCMGPQPDRSFRPGHFGTARVATGPRGRSPQLGPAAESRSDRPAAGGGDGRDVRQ